LVIDGKKKEIVQLLFFFNSGVKKQRAYQKRKSCS